MLGRLPIRWFGVAFAIGFVASAYAASLGVTKVDFRLVDRPESNDRWYEVAVQVDVASDGQASVRDERFADEVRVQLHLAFEVRKDGERSLDFYSSEAEFAALEVGRHTVRFYLPPEIVQRDRLRGVPDGFEIIAVGAGERSATFHSSNLDADGRLERFRSLAQEAAGANEGTMLPQWATPFRTSYPDDSPSPRLRGVAK